MDNFIPDRPTNPVFDIPFFEDVTSKDATGRYTQKKIGILQKEITGLFLKLGGGNVQFTQGQYPSSPRRYGYRIHFSMNGIPGRIDIAALPMRSETDIKKDRALAQCLFLFRDYLQSEANSIIYRPGAIPLIPYLIGSGDRTVTESLIETKILPDMSRYTIFLDDGKK